VTVKKIEEYYIRGNCGRQGLTDRKWATGRIEVKHH
jgi:hypothetical protein